MSKHIKFIKVFNICRNNLEKFIRVFKSDLLTFLLKKYAALLKQLLKASLYHIC